MTKNSSSPPETANLSGKKNKDDAIRGRWEIILLAAILLLSLVLRLWGLDQNRWGAEYYTAAVRSMSASWHNFFYAAFDPAGFISVDKPPLALWLQVLSVKIFGFRPLSVLLPQILMGVGSVLLLYHLVRRHFSAPAALLAALFMATTPVWVAVNRTNNTDTCLLLVLLFAAWALMKAAEEGSRGMLILSMAIVGLAFNVKMLAAYIVLPAFCLVYLVGARASWPRKFADLALAFIILVVISFSWVLFFDLTPKDSRPFAGGSHDNSMLELVIGHNAFNRFFSPLKSRAAATTGSPTKQAPAEEFKPIYSEGSDTVHPLRVLFYRMFMTNPPGPLRLFGGQTAAQVLWLFPFALLAVLIVIGRERLKWPLSGRYLTVLFWFSWLATYVAVYSYLGGIIHFYYLSTMAPALAALAGIGVAGMWDHYCRRSAFALLLPAMLLLTTAWQFHIQSGALGWSFSQSVSLPIIWMNRLHIALLAGSIFAVFVLLMVYFLRIENRFTAVFARGALAVGLAVVLIIPGAWAIGSVLTPGHGLIPSADLYRLIAVNGDQGLRIRLVSGQSGSTAKLLKFLKDNHKGERYLLMTSTTEFAAPIIIRTGEAVITRGGFHGIDHAATPDSLARMVKAGLIRYVMLGDVATVSRKMNSDANGKLVDDWVRANGKIVDPLLWQSRRMTWRGMELYDLKSVQNDKENDKARP